MKNKLFWYSLVATLSLFFLGMDVMAADEAKGLGALAKAFTTEVSAFKVLALGVFYLGGVIAFGTGLFYFYKETKQPGQNHLPKGFAGVLVGGALIALPSLLNTTAESMGGQGENAMKSVESAEF